MEQQRNLNLLESWGVKWGMRFNAAKCNIMRVSRMRLPFLYSHKLSGQVLDEVKDSKYLGVTISDNLDWSKHISTTTTKANARLSFIKRNLKDCPQKLKEIAYFSLVRSFVDYASAVWDPHQNIGSALLMSEKYQAVYYISSCHMPIDKALSSDKPNSHWFEADWLHCKRDALSSNRKVDGSRLTGSNQTCHS